MLIARVIGEVVATQKHASHEGRKILVVQPLNLDGSDRGDAVLALDAVDAGVGDKVLLVTEGFRDFLEIGRGSRYDNYDINIDMPQPLVPRRWRRGRMRRTWLRLSSHVGPGDAAGPMPAQAPNRSPPAAGGNNPRCR